MTTPIFRMSLRVLQSHQILACSTSLCEAEADFLDFRSDNGSSETESNISSDEVAGGAVMPTVAAAAPQPAEQQPVHRRDPGWDDTDDSNYVPGASESE